MQIQVLGKERKIRKTREDIVFTKGVAEREVLNTIKRKIKSLVQ